MCFPQASTDLRDGRRNSAVSSGSNGGPKSAVKTKVKSQTGMVEWRGGFKHLTPLINFMTRSCFPTEQISSWDRKWKAEIAATWNTYRFHSSVLGCHIVPRAWDRRFLLKDTAQGRPPIIPSALETIAGWAIWVLPEVLTTVFPWFSVVEGVAASLE